MAPENTLLGNEQPVPEFDIDDLIKQYIEVLLGYYDVSVEETEVDIDDQKMGETIGTIMLVIDDNIEEASSKGCANDKKFFDPRTLHFFLPREGANIIEVTLVKWGIDFKALMDVVKAFRPCDNNADHEFYEAYIESAAAEIADIFMHAIVVLPGTPPSAYFRKRSSCDGYC